MQEIPKTLQEAFTRFASPLVAHNLMVSLLWPDGKPKCPHCGSNIVGKFSGKRMVSNCKGCKKQFTVRMGTIFGDSPLPLTKWIPAVWLIVNAKNGISSYKIGRSLGVTQKTAWFMMHRIRLALQNGTLVKIGGEQAFRFNERKDCDSGRFMTAIKGIVGKSLSCIDLIGKGGDDLQQTAT